MKAEHVESFTSAGATTFHAAGLAGIPIATIIQWFVQYGLPLLLKVLPLILPLLAGDKKLTIAQAVKWASDALAALSHGKDLPPMPIAAK